MAQVGDVVVALKATTSGFRGPLQQAQQDLARTSQEMRGVAASAKQVDASTAIANQRFREAFGASTQAVSGLKALEQDLRLAKADFAAGLISAEDYATALRHVRMEAMQMRGNLSGAELGTFNRLMGQTAPTAARARQGLGTIRSSLASLTARMTVANGTLGTLLGGLAQFAVGNAVAIGVIAGIAAIAAGFRALTKSARDAAERMREVSREAVDRFRSQPGVQGHLVRADLQRFEALEVQQRASVAFYRSQVAALAAIGEEPGAFLSRALERAENAFLATTFTIEGLRQQLRELGPEAQSVADKIKELTEALFPSTGLGPSLVPAESRTLTNRLGLRGLDDIFPRPTTPRGVPPQIADQLKAVVYEMERTGQNGARAFAEAFGDSDESMNRAGAKVGESIIRGVIRSLTDRRVDLGRVFANTIAALLEEALVSAIRNALNKTRSKGSLFGDFASLASTIVSLIPGAGPVVKGAQKAKDFSGLASVAAPSAGVTLNVSVAAPGNPLAVARDADWLRALGDSANELRSRGFKFT